MHLPRRVSIILKLACTDGAVACRLKWSQSPNGPHRPPAAGRSNPARTSPPGVTGGAALLPLARAGSRCKKEQVSRASTSPANRTTANRGHCAVGVGGIDVQFAQITPRPSRSPATSKSNPRLRSWAATARPAPAISDPVFPGSVARVHRAGLPPGGIATSGRRNERAARYSGAEAQ